MMALPAGAPESIGAAFGHVNAVTAPTLLDLKVMVLVEAAAERLYHASAETAEHPGVRDLLIENGHEEMKHAHRVAQAIKVISGEDFPPPSAENNPYLSAHIPTATLTAEGLRAQAQTEFAGDALYGLWADAIDNPAAAALFRLNGAEETDHGNRLLQAAALLEG